MASPAFYSQVSDLRGEAVTPTGGVVKLYPEEATCIDYMKSLKGKAVLCSLMPALETPYERGARMCPEHQAFTFLSPQQEICLQARSFPNLLLLQYSLKHLFSQVTGKQNTGSRGLSRCLPGTAILYALSLGSQCVLG